MKISFSILPALLLCHLTAFCSVGGDTSKTVSKLNTFLTGHPGERAYLQFDKPYYAAGDTMYFKAYVVMGERHALSLISGVLHADLVGTDNKIIQSIILRLDTGLAHGDFALPDSLPAGNYRIRAWTRWMRNDPGSFFQKIIPIGSLQSHAVPENALPGSRMGKPDLQFFPEGGTLVAGIRSRVAFKAIAADGLGVAVQGLVMDDSGDTVTSFASAHLGMGSFSFVPRAGKSYHARVAFAGGASDSFSLPRPEQQGIALSVDNDSIPEANVHIMTDSAYFKENRGRTYTLLIYSGGIAATVSCPLDSLVTSLEILKRRLFTGIARITLFSPDNEPLCERLIFVQNFDQLSLNVSTDQASYSPRGKVVLKLHALTRADSAAVGHFSVSVTDESKVPVAEDKETSILTDLLLTDDLKGYVEQPNYYFTGITQEKLHDLDLVMLTHGYRRFAWKQVLDDHQPPVAYQPERGITISGTAKTLPGKPIAKGTVTLIPDKGGPLLTQTTDDRGNFSFRNLDFTGSTSFVLNATKANGKNSTQISYHPETEPEVDTLPGSESRPDTLMMPYLENTEKQQEQLNMLGTGKGKLLKEVRVKARKLEPLRTSNGGYGIVDQVIHGDQIRYGGGLAIRLMGLLKNVKWIGRGPLDWNPVLRINTINPSPMIVVWNDQPMPAGFNISSINTASIDRIEVVSNDPSNPQGVLLIYTKNGLQEKDITSTGILTVSVNGFYKARIFYAPKYDNPDSLNRKDLRSTIYWQPELNTDKNGNASLEFYNADGKGNYRVVVEGIDDKGNIGRKVYQYKVE
ncbi:MAG TPA: MG2 domain-containing protein [Mucilaginibacter sp.]|nr:MG2 domain-containing protein [Mucilaginibacter sp.]